MVTTIASFVALNYTTIVHFKLVHKIGHANSQLKLLCRATLKSNKQLNMGCEAQLA